MPLPVIDEQNRKKPLCYDPRRRKFIYYDDLVSRSEQVVPVDGLSQSDLKKLVAERLRAGPDFVVQAISGPPMNRDDVVRAVELDEPFGRVTLEAERSYLRDVLRQIEASL